MSSVEGPVREQDLHWGGLNANEQCHKCRSRIKLRPCGICLKLFCIACYEVRWGWGMKVYICEYDNHGFLEKLGKGGAIKAVNKEWYKRQVT